METCFDAKSYDALVAFNRTSLEWKLRIIVHDMHAELVF